MPVVLIVKPAAPLAPMLLALATCALLYARLKPLVFKVIVSPLTAPVTLPLTLAPVAAVVPSYVLLVAPPMLAVALKALAVMLALTAVTLGPVKL